MNRQTTIPRRFLALAAAPAALAALAVSPAPATAQGLTPEQVVALRAVGSVALS